MTSHQTHDFEHSLRRPLTCLDMFVRDSPVPFNSTKIHFARVILHASPDDFSSIQTPAVGFPPDVFLLDDGASMMVASTSVPDRSVMPLSARCAFTSAKIASVSPGPSALRPCLWITRRDQRQETAPWHDGLHLRQELLPPRHLLLHRVTKTGNGRLLRHRRNSSRVFPQPIRSSPSREVLQGFPSFSVHIFHSRPSGLRRSSNLVWPSRRSLCGFGRHGPIEMVRGPSVKSALGSATQSTPHVPTPPRGACRLRAGASGVRAPLPLHWDRPASR